MSPQNGNGSVSKRLSGHLLPHYADRALDTTAKLAASQQLELILVGGAVRDLLLGTTPNDLDLVLVSPARPDVAAASSYRAVPVDRVQEFVHSASRRLRLNYVKLDEARGTYRLVLKDDAGDLVGVEQSPRYLDIAALIGDDLAVDLKRRDFTINAMAATLDGRHLFDPTGGRADLDSRRIRTPDRQNLRQDPLRLLRAFRCAAEIGGAIEATTLAWIEQLAETIREPAAERVGEEIWKLLNLNCAEYAESMQKRGLLDVLLGAGEISPDIEVRLGAAESMKGLGEHQSWVARWLSESLASGIRRRAVLKLALMADLASAETLRQRASNELRSPNSVSDHVLRIKRAVPAAKTALLDATGPESGDKLELPWGEYYFDHEAAGLEGVLCAHWGSSERTRVTTALALYRNTLRPRLDSAPLLRGEDVLSMGVKQGPAVGQLLAQTRRRQLQGRLRSRAQALEFLRDRIEQQR